MSTITYTRHAKCKDCNQLKYYYKGKIKRHKCIRKNTNRCLNDLICEDCNLNVDWNITAIPERLEVTP